MAKKQSGTAGASKSDAIRDVLRSNPNAKVKEIKADMDRQGIKVSTALISKVKYERSGKTSRRKKSRRGAARNGSSHVSKADAIREMFGQLGRSARPRDVVAALAEKGVGVSSAQVSMVRKSLSRRRGKKSVAVANAISVANPVSLDHLVAAKAIAERLGGIAVARQALADLAKIMGG